MRWFITTFLVASFCTICWAADAQFPKPRPASAPQDTAAPVQAPAVPPAPIVVASPSVSVSPQLVAPQPSTLDEIKSWLSVTFGGLIALLLAKIGFRPAAPGGVTPDPLTALVALRDKTADPDTRRKIDETLLTVFGTGIPSKVIQSGLGFVPVAGPALAGLEPLLHDAFMGFLKNKLTT